MNSLNPLDDLMNSKLISIEASIGGYNTIKVRCVYSTNTYSGNQYFVDTLLMRLKQAGLTTINEAILMMEALNSQLEEVALFQRLSQNTGGGDWLFPAESCSLPSGPRQHRRPTGGNANRRSIRMSTRMIRIYRSTEDLPPGREGWIANVAGVLYIFNGTTWEPMEGEDEGTVATARINLATNPTHDDTLTIGADTYQFKVLATDTIVTNDAYIAVTRAGTVADTRTNLVAAINGTANAEHATVTQADEETPAVGVGTENVVADVVGNTVRIRSADAPGGTAEAADPSIVLAENLTAAADVWDVGNVNMNTLAGQAATTRKHAISAEVALTAAMLVSGIKIDFPFTPTAFRVNARKATGVPAYANGAVTDTWTLVSTGVLFTPGTPGGGNLVATDLVQVEAWE